jgi:hypothetical protein
MWPVPSRNGHPTNSACELSDFDKLWGRAVCCNLVQIFVWVNSGAKMRLLTIDLN